MARNPFEPPKANTALSRVAESAAVTPDAGELLCSPA